MLALLTLAAVCGGWRLAGAALQALRRLPRSNDDLIFF